MTDTPTTPSIPPSLVQALEVLYEADRSQSAALAMVCVGMAELLPASPGASLPPAVLDALVAAMVRDPDPGTTLDDVRRLSLERSVAARIMGEVRALVDPLIQAAQ